MDRASRSVSPCAAGATAIAICVPADRALARDSDDLAGRRMRKRPPRYRHGVDAASATPPAKRFTNGRRAATPGRARLDPS